MWNSVSIQIKPEKVTLEKLTKLESNLLSLQAGQTPAEEEPASLEGRKQKPFHAFGEPLVLKGKLVSLPVSAMFQSTPRPVTAPSTVASSVLQGAHSGLVKQDFTAFRKPSRPSVRPAVTVGRQSGESASSQGGEGDNEQEAITGVESSDTGTGINTLLPDKTQTIRNPKTVSTLPASSINRVPVKTRTKTVKVKHNISEDLKETGKRKHNSFTSSEHLDSKRLIFKDSTIAVSPGSILVDETFTSSTLDDAQPTVQLPFVIEGTAGEGEWSDRDVNVPIVIEEKQRNGKVKVMTEVEFESLFSTEPPKKNKIAKTSTPKNQFFKVCIF